MGVSRKPVPYPVTPTGGSGSGPPPALRRKDSWEDYSDEEDGPETLSNDDTHKTAAAQRTYIPYRAGVMVNDHGQASNQAAATPEQPHQLKNQPSDANRSDQIPDSLRPGGLQGQTNPFLRNQTSQNTNVPPSDQLAGMNLGESAGKPWQPLQPKQTGSSNYDTPPATVVSETNPWLEPENASYSPASETILFPQEGPNTVAKASYSHSPINMDVDPWDPTPTSAPRLPQPPQEPHQPQPPSLTSQPTGSNPWADSVGGAASSTHAQPPPVPSMTPSPQPPSSPAPPVYNPPPVPQSSPAPLTPDPSSTMAAPVPLAPHVQPSSSPPTTLPALTPSPQPPSSSYGDNNPFAAQNRASPQPPASQSHSPAALPIQPDKNSAFADASQNQSSRAPQLPPLVTLDHDNSDSGGAAQDFWEDLGAQTTSDKGKEKAAASQVEEWNLIDAGEASNTVGTSFGESNSDQQPTLPPRPAGGENSQWTSPRAPIDAKTETYPVKKIKWHDAEASENPRVSPILVQNANGPCPLVALVNALSLTTPPNVDESSLVEVLRSREQISLNLLLDAVFEELMSPRRMDPDMALPDVGDLYAFLMSLHTGMNVNPRFMPTDAMREAYERTSLTQLNPSERANHVPGTFENTHEMHLYATFKIPLIHGWLPPSSDPAYTALERRAPSYEDAQNILFHEEELDRKLSSPDGLTREEQELYQDIVTIKGFLESSATQLTSWGIQVISKAIRPGTFAILFRNDHFSTLYCHPQSKELVTLVTDEGYRTHEELVWESLVDINGERTQYLSGDFKVVGSGESTTSGTYGDQGGQWTTVPNRRGKEREQPETAGGGGSGIGGGEEAPMSAIEQEDRDLALAMQLQEEEDQRHRDDEARRNREREQSLSNQYIEQQGRTPYGNTGSGTRASNGIAPARRSSNNISMNVVNPSTTGSQRYPSQQQQQQQPQQQQPRTTPHQQVRPLVPPRRHVPPTHRPDASGADAPPPYEQAGQDQLFEPPPGHPNHATSTSDISRQTTNASGATAASAARPNTRPQFATPQNSQVPVGGRFPGQMGPGSRLHAANSGRERDRDCVVM